MVAMPDPEELPGDGPWRVSSLSRATAYHTDPTCSRLAKAAKVREATESEIAYHGLDECSGCAGEAGTGTNGGPVPKAGIDTTTLQLGGGDGS